MKRVYILIFFMLFVAVVLTGMSLYYSIIVYKTFNSKALTSHVFEGEIEFIVEIDPSVSVCGDGVCNGSETTSSCPADCVVSTTTSTGASGGGGGGIAYTPTVNFIVTPETLNVEIIAGDSKSFELFVKNAGSGTISVNAEVSGISNIASFNKDRVIIGSGKTDVILMTVNAGKPGVYAGKVKFKSGGVSKEILVLINVISSDVLFDVSVTIPETYKKIEFGEKIQSLIELDEIGDLTGLDVTINYIIKDFDGNLVSFESETFFVDGAMSYNWEYDTSGLPPGDYVVGIELKYPGGIATASDHFRISVVKINIKTIVSIILLIFALIVIYFVWRYYHKRGKMIKRMRAIRNKNKKK